MDYRNKWILRMFQNYEAGTKVLASQFDLWIVEKDAVVEWALLR